jgi:hypothetical protein
MSNLCIRDAQVGYEVDKRRVFRFIDDTMRSRLRQ